MSADDSDDSGRSVEERLRSFIGAEFSDVPREELSEALQEVSGVIDEEESGGEAELPEEPQEESGRTQRGTPVLARTSSGSYERVTDSEAEFLDSVSSAIEPLDLDREGEIPLVTVSPRDDDELSRVFGQVLDVQAFWLKVEDPPPLNHSVEILLDIPQYGFESALPGRVVHRAESRMAVALSGITEEDLESIRDVFQRHQFRAHQRDTERDVSLSVDSSARGAADIDVSQTWDGAADSSLALSRTFERVSEDESYWYGPRSPWMQPDAIGTTGEVLRELDPEELLLDVSARGFTGLVEFAGGERQFQLQIEEGYVVEVSARPHEEREELGPMLRVAERVSEDQLAEASSYAIKKDLTLQRALADLEVIPVEEIRRAAAGRLTYLLRMLCDLGPGTAQLTPREELRELPLPDSDVRVHVAVERVVFRRRIDHFHGLPTERRDSLIEDHSGEHPRVSAGAAGRIERAFADEAHRAFVSRTLDGRLPLRDLIAESFLPPGETVSVLFALRSMDLVEFPGAPDTSRAVEQFEDDLEIQHLSVHKASYFEVLNVHWSSYDRVVEEGYQRRRSYFEPDDAPEGLPRKSRRRLEEIAERIDSAYRVLKDRKSRHEYRKKIMPEYKLDHAIPLLMRRGQLAVRQGEHELARDSFSRVLEIDPDHREAAQELGSVEGSSSAAVEA